jgi:hypothetical protein
MEVYIATSGAYSDYHIVAAFSDKTKADAFAEKVNSADKDYYWDKVDIETYQLDMPKCQWARTLVVIDESGEVVHTSLNVAEQIATPHFSKWSLLKGQTVALELSINTPDKQRAIKAAHEKWAAIKAAIPWGNSNALALLCGKSD